MSRENASEHFSEVLRELTVTDEMVQKAMDEFVLWTDPRDGMAQALLAALRPARERIHKETRS